MVRNVAVEAEKKTITIKATVQPESGIRHPRRFMGMLGVNPSIKLSGLDSSFQSEEKNSMLAEEPKEYALASAADAYEYPGQHAPMVFMA